MAGPSAAITLLVKKFIIDTLADPEKLLKTLLYGIILPLLSFLLILILPIILILNVPSVLLSGNTSSEMTDLQLNTIGLYQEAPVIINDTNLKWINEKKSQYSWCDDIVVNYNYDLSWQHLMAIDSVTLEQDFSKANANNILKLAEMFIIRDTSVETYQVLETRTYSFSDGKGNVYSGSYTVTVTKYRAIISAKTKPFSQVLSEIGFDSFDKELATNIYNTILNSDVEGNFNIYDDIDLSELKEYPPGSANIPYFNQADKRWGAFSYGNSTIKSGGCGPTSLAMVVAGLKARIDINPKSVADWSYANGHRAEGQGSYWSLMSAGGNNYGLKVEQVSRKNPKAIVKALSEGYPVIASMGRGHFTNGGHFIVLRGLTSDGKVLVYDSASVERSNRPWDLGIIMNESSTNGGVNGSPFWIFKP